MDSAKSLKDYWRGAFMYRQVQIRRLSRLLRYSCILGLILAPSLTAFYWMHDGFRVYAFNQSKWFIQFADAPFTAIDELSTHIKFLGFLIDLIPCFFFLLTLFILIRLFKSYERYHFFTTKTVRYIRQIALILLISQLVHPLYVALHSFILSLPNPGGERIILFAYGPNQVKTLFLACILFLAAYVMEVGRYFQDEYSTTI